ncbi:hypothetical protein GB937_010765 [Aspergillus fischeri]|nr:hypothetical protein GB937_010765 [Aspergillus fischeri]
MGIEGKKTADAIADQGALSDHLAEGPDSLPTASGIYSEYQRLQDAARQEWWTEKSAKLPS